MEELRLFILGGMENSFNNIVSKNTVVFWHSQGLLA